MKYVACILVVTLFCLVGLGAYLYINADMTIVLIQLTQYDAQSQASEFERCKSNFENGSLITSVYENAQIGEAEDYTFLTYTVHLKNTCLVNAEMIEIQLEPVQGDVLAYNTNQTTSLKPNNEGDYNIILLTRKGNNAVRRIIITYYLWGYPFTMMQTYG